MSEEKENYIEKIKICDLSFAVGCNFRCKMCYSWQAEPPGPEIMTVSDWKNFILQLAELCGQDLKLNFSGCGEVLLRAGVEDILNFASRRFKVFLNTNGYFVNEAMAATLAKTLEAISLSLDGANAQTHDYLRGVPGAYERVLSAIQYLRGESPEMIITINTVILDKNLEEIFDLVEWVDNRRINGIIFQAVSMPNNISYDRFWFKNNFAFLWPNNPEKAAGVIDGLIQRKRQGSKIINSVAQLECFKSYFLNPEKTVKGLRCEVERVLKVDSKGNIRICDFSTPAGNVKKEHVYKILSSEAAEQQRQKAYDCREPCHLLINCFHDQGEE